MGERKKVLLIDGNEEFRSMIQEEIEKSSEFCVMASVGSGTEALKLVEEEVPDLIVTDVILPGLDGFSLIKRLREQVGQEIHVIFLSAFCGDQAVKEAMDLGASYFLSKPCMADALLDRMHAAFQESKEEESYHPAELKNRAGRRLQPAEYLQYAADLHPLRNCRLGDCGKSGSGCGGFPVVL